MLFLIARLTPHVAPEGKGYLDVLSHKLNLGPGGEPKRRNLKSETLAPLTEGTV